MNVRGIVLFSVVGLLIAACSKHNTETPPDMGYDYYPGKVKSFVVYDVDSVYYNPIHNPDSTHNKFQIKEKFDTLFHDNQNRPTLKIIRYKKIYNPNTPYSQMAWVIEKVWAANITKTTAEVVEDNNRYIKLVFPARQNITWNGNAVSTFNELGAQVGEWDYKYTAYDVPATINNMTFQKTCTVTQQYFPTAISLQDYYEQYARGVGMIYKEITDYQYKQDSSGAHTGVIYQGVHYVMKINSYGTE